MLRNNFKFVGFLLILSSLAFAEEDLEVKYKTPYQSKSKVVFVKNDLSKVVSRVMKTSQKCFEGKILNIYVNGTLKTQLMFNATMAKKTATAQTIHFTQHRFFKNSSKDKKKFFMIADFLTKNGGTEIKVHYNRDISKDALIKWAKSEDDACPDLKYLTVVVV